MITLNNNETWKNNSEYNITSLHLIGAAISDRAASKNNPFGIAIDNIVDNFYNLYNPKDNLLQGLYIKTENENPLGLLGLHKDEPFPSNYTELNVMSEIKDEPFPSNYTELNVMSEIPPLRMVNA